MRRNFRQVFFQADESGGGAAVAEPPASEYRVPSPSELLDFAASELDNAVASQTGAPPAAPSTTIPTGLGALDDQPAPTPAPAAPVAAAPADTPPAAPLGGLDFFRKVATPEPAKAPEPAAPVGTPVVPVAEMTPADITNALKTPGGKYRLIAALYDSGDPEMAAMAQSLEGRAPVAAPSQDEPAATTEPDPLDVPEFDREAVRAQIEAQLIDSMKSDYPDLIDFDENGNEVVVKSRLSAEQRREIARETARLLENAETKHESKRTAATVQKWQRDQAKKAEEAETRELSEVYQWSENFTKSIYEKGIPIKVGEHVGNSRELFTENGRLSQLRVAAFERVRAKLENEFFESVRDSRYRPSIDLGPLKSSLPPPSGQKARDMRVLAEAFTRFAIGEYVTMLRREHVTAGSVANGAANGTTPTPPVKAPSWPSNLPGPASNAAGLNPPGSVLGNPSTGGEDIAKKALEEIGQEHGARPSPEAISQSMFALLNKVASGQ